jgi:hypothetical protein
MPLDYERLNRKYGPWVSLGLGIATVVFVRRGVRYAPIALATLMLAWGLAWFLKHRRKVVAVPGGTPDASPDALADASPDALPDASPDAQPNAQTVESGLPDGRVRIRRLLPSAGVTASVALYQNVLFYLVPVWAASATWPSSNVIFPLLLGVMAFFSCFEYPYRAVVLERPLGLGVFSGVTMFAALVPVATVLLELPLRVSMLSCAAVASIAASAAVIAARRTDRLRGLLWFILAIGLSTGSMVLVAPYLPPVPVVCAQTAAGTAIQDRQLLGQSDHFQAEVQRVYAWFRVAAPARWKQPVQFQWYRNEDPSGGPLDHELSGGRETGFRTWTYRNAPGTGDWRVDMITDSGQLVGRVRFQVGTVTE